MSAYMKHLIGPYGPKGIPAQLSAKTIEALQYVKLWEKLLAQRDRDEEMRAIREGRWTTYRPLNLSLEV